MLNTIFKIFILILIIAITFIVIFVPYLIPPIAERLVLEKIKSIKGLERFDLNVQTISIAGIGVGNITTGESISIDSIFCHYSLKSLINKTVNSINISGLEINGVMDGSSFSLTDFAMPKKVMDRDNKNNRGLNNIGVISQLLHFVPSVIKIEHSVFTLQDSINNRTFALPFNLICKIDNKEQMSNMKTVNLLLTPILFGNKLKISIEMEIATNVSENIFRSIVISVHNISWSLVNELINIFSPDLGIKFTGNSDIIFATVGDDISQWKIALSHIGMAKPIQSEINNVVLNIHSTDLNHLIAAEGTFWFGNNIISPINFVYNFTLNKDKQWSLLLKGKEMWRDKPFIIRVGEEDSIKLTKPTFQIFCNGGQASFDGKLTAGVGDLIYKEQGIKLGRVDVNLPFNYKNNTKRLTLDGKLNVGEVATLPVRSTILLLKDTGVKADLNYKLNRVNLTPNLIKKIYTDQNLFSGMDFSINVVSDGNFYLFENHIESTINLNFENGRFSIPEKKVDISGVNTSISFKGIPEIKPIPAQILTIDKVNIKDLRVSNAQLRYTIESIPTKPDIYIDTHAKKSEIVEKSSRVKSKYSPSLLIENLSFNWCDGKVISESMRLSSNQDEYQINLFCDRLKLSSILQQIGAFNAEGDGALNGRIPVSISGQNISFDNGFLYSTPGEGGTIKISGADKITAGIPEGTVQFNQLDLAKEALKSYKYEWARLGFDTKGEQLFVKMEFDGKPENILPFVYKEELGGFVRVSADNAGSNFQGIKIDVNLQLPFNRVLKFGNKINSLFK